uniref:Huntingtin n=1 Tax=Denticeps clupeoides TaxID=299321 RepID=A0AAY4AQK9_9TELE
MATMEKLMKAFESLKSFQQQQGPPSAEELVQKQKKDLATTKKDRVTHCLTICENIVAQSLRTSPEFQKLLGIAMEMFLLCSDDKESDVRMVADECLNKIIKALMDSNLPRLQLELYKEIKKNGASRSLRAALWRFAELAHLVRPQKCRPYFVNLLPCLTRITKRQEESVQETLATAIPKIMAALGNFANDGEIKVLLKAFVANLKSSSPTIRRTAASSAVSVCQNSRRTHYFYAWLLNVLLGLVVPVDAEYPSHLILGVLLTLRYLMPLLQQQVPSTSLKGSFGVMRKEADIGPAPEQLVQVYELTLHYTQHCDHNVVTASLELLQQTFRTPPPELLNVLITRGGILNASVFREDAESRARSGSILELIGKMLSGEEEGLEDDPETRSEVTTGSFAASVGGDSSSDPTASSSGVSSLTQADIITEQPRSSQHALQPGDSVDLSASSEGVAVAGGSDTPDDEEEMLSRSSSQISGGGGSGVAMVNQQQASAPPSDSSQTTTEGPDSAVTPSECPELVLDGNESQYSGMQIGTLQDEEEEATAPAPEEPLDPFSQSVLALRKPHLLESKGHNRQASDSSVDRFITKDEVLEPADLDSRPSRIKGEIGHYTDLKEEPLVHCVRLLAAYFLLTGQKNGLVPDREVRVSVKALAVSCVGAAAALHPEAFFNTLYLEPLDGLAQDEQQYITDILKYIDHGDPQIRGATAILCGAVIQSILLKTRFNVEVWLSTVQSCTGNPVSLVDFVPLLQKSLRDESSVTCKMACFSVRHCIMTLCNSSHSELGLQLIIDLMTLRDCSYWLVRTELLETLAEIDFRLVSFLEHKTESLHKGEHHYLGLLRLQDRVLNDVILHLLGDDDPRVRHVAATTISRMVSRLFYDCDQAQADPVVAIARDQSSVYLQLLMHETQPPSHFTVSAITRTYRGYSLSQGTSDVTIDNNLSRVITVVAHALTSSTSRALTFGCCEALCLLSITFPVCTWSTGWHCGYISSSVSHVNRSSLYRSRGRSHSLSQSGSGEEGRRSLTVGMANMVLSLLSSAWFPLDLSAHQDALLLTANLLAAAAPKSLKSPWGSEEETNTPPNKQEEPWPALGDRSLVVMVEQLFSHLLKILNICAHVLDDTPPGPAVKNLWSIIKCEIYKEGKQYTSLNSVWEAVVAAARNVDGEQIKTLTESMDGRLLSVLAKKGGYIGR